MKNTSSSAPRRNEAMVTVDITKEITQMAAMVAVQLCSSGGVFGNEIKLIVLHAIHIFDVPCLMLFSTQFPTLVGGGELKTLVVYQIKSK